MEASSAEFESTKRLLFRSAFVIDISIAVAKSLVCFLLATQSLFNAAVKLLPKDTLVPERMSITNVAYTEKNPELENVDDSDGDSDDNDEDDNEDEEGGGESDDGGGESDDGGGDDDGDDDDPEDVPNINGDAESGDDEDEDEDGDGEDDENDEDEDDEEEEEEDDDEETPQPPAKRRK